MGPLERRTRALPVLALLAGAWAAGAGCTPDFEVVEIVKDLRILAIRAEPPEILLSKIPDTWPAVKVDALVVDPSQTAGWRAEWELWGCGVQSGRLGCCPDDGACAADSTRVKLGEGTTTPDQIGASVVLDRDRYMAAMKSDPGYGLGGVPVLVELRVRAAGGSGAWTRGIKRLVYGVYDQIDLTCLPPIDPGSLDLCIQQQRCEQFINVCVRDSVCSPCSGIPTEDLETLRPKLPNRNPEANWVKVSLGQKETEDSQAVPTTWTVMADDPAGKSPWQVDGGEEYFLLPKPDPVAGAQREIYVVGSRIPTYDKAAQTFQYTQVLTEYLTFHFYATDGGLSHATTGGKPSRFLVDKKVTEISASWSPPKLDGPDDPAEKDVRLWVVVNDDRGGVGWISLSARARRAVKKDSSASP